MYNTVNINKIKSVYLDWNFPLNFLQSNPLDSFCTSLIQSMQNYGCLSPILCIKTNNNYYLIDGFKRLHIAGYLGHSDIPVSAINLQAIQETHSQQFPPSNYHSTIDTTTQIIFELHKNQLQLSPLLKLRFLKTLEIEPTQHNLAWLSLPYTTHVNRDIKRILSLPTDIQQFLDQKKFSFKEILHLIHYSVPCLEQLIKDNAYFNFSKRRLDQFMSGTADLMKRNKWSFEKLFDSISYESIKLLDLTPQQRILQLLRNIEQLISPTHVSMTGKITTAINELKSESNLDINYDSSFESAEITISKTIRNSDDIHKLSQQLTAPKTTQKLQAILNQL